MEEVMMHAPKSKRNVTKLTLDEEKRLFYAAIGEAITEWSHVEDWLCMILSACMQPGRYQVLPAVFYSVENLRSKLRMVESSLTITFPQGQHLDDWKRLQNAISSKSKLRNALAHHQVFVNEARKPGKRYNLRGAIMNPLGPDIFDESTGLYMNELAERVNVFKALADRIKSFYRDTVAQQRLLPQGFLGLEDHQR